MEEMTLRRADRVIFASPAARDRALRRVEGLAARSETVLTGFDAREFPSDAVSVPPPGRLEVVHAGSVLVMNRLPTLLRLLAALQMWSARDPRVAATVHVRFVGAEPVVRDCIARAGLASWVRVEPPVGRAQLPGLLRGAHVCLALASSGRAGGDPVPGKLFDAIGADRPVLALAPPSALATLVREHALGRAVDPVDGRAVVAALSALHERALRGEPIPGPSEASRRAFASDAAVARIITALERARRGGRSQQEDQRCVYPSAS
jgi:hypothetical protein